MYGLSEADGIGLLVVATLIWGLNGGLKKSFTADTDIVSFSVVFTLSRFLLAIILWLSFSQPTLSLSSEVILNISYDFLGGVTSMFGNYMYFACLKYISLSSVKASSTLTTTIFGVTIDYLISSTDIVLVFLVLGTFLSICGLGFVVLAEAFGRYSLFEEEEEKEEEEYFHSARSVHSNIASNVSGSRAGRSTRSSEALRRVASNPSFRDEASSLLSGVSTRRVKIVVEESTFVVWFGIACLSGVMFSGFSVFSTLEDTNNDSIDDPILTNLIFQAGQVFALPITIYLLAHLELLGPLGIKVNSVQEVWDDVRQTPSIDLIWCCIIGGLSGAASSLYFISTTVVPYAIAYGISMSQCVVSTLSSIFIFRDFNIGGYAVPIALVVLGAISYGSSIFVLVEYALS